MIGASDNVAVGSATENTSENMEIVVAYPVSPNGRKSESIHQKSHI